MDYRYLLRKYMAHVGDQEGVTFVREDFYRHIRDVNRFTDEEWAELQRLDSEPIPKVLVVQR